MTKSKSSKSQESKVQVSRDAVSGKFVPKSYANSHPKTTVIEKIKKKKP